MLLQPSEDATWLAVSVVDGLLDDFVAVAFEVGDSGAVAVSEADGLLDGPESDAV